MLLPCCDGGGVLTCGTTHLFSLFFNNKKFIDCKLKISGAMSGRGGQKNKQEHCLQGETTPRKPFSQYNKLQYNYNTDTTTHRQRHCGKRRATLIINVRLADGELDIVLSIEPPTPSSTHTYKSRSKQSKAKAAPKPASNNRNRKALLLS